MGNGCGRPSIRGGLTVAVVNDVIYAIGGAMYSLDRQRLMTNEHYIPDGYDTLDQFNREENWATTIVTFWTYCNSYYHLHRVRIVIKS
jgi:hypothetical protein